MKKTTTIPRPLMLAFLLCLFFSASQAIAKKPEVALNAPGEKLLADYTGMLDSLKKEIAASIPKLDEGKRAAYLAAHAEIANLEKLPNPQGLKIAPVTYCAGNPAYAEAQATALIAARELLKEAEPFLGGQGWAGDPRTK